MRIAHFIRALIAVLGLAAVVYSEPVNRYSNDSYYQFQRVKTAHSDQEPSFHLVECCPTVSEIIEPNGGKNQLGLLVQLYRDENYIQRFHEISCREENKPCKFINKKMHSRSYCKQNFSWSYALVENTNSTEHVNTSLPRFPANAAGSATFVLDYIEVRSGCSCVVAADKKKKKKNPKKHHGIT